MESDFASLRAHLTELHRTRTFRQIAEQDYGGKINHAVIHRIVVYGSQPQKPEIRRALGLPELIEVPIHRDEMGRFAKRK